MTTVSNAFVPVSDPGQAAEWYSEHLMLRVVTISEWSAVLTGDGGATVTLMGPLSGIAAKPGLAWATCGFLVEDLTGMRDRLLRKGLVCLWWRAIRTTACSSQSGTPTGTSCCSRTARLPGSGGSLVPPAPQPCCFTTPFDRRAAPTRRLSRRVGAKVSSKQVMKQHRQSKAG